MHNTLVKLLNTLLIQLFILLFYSLYLFTLSLSFVIRERGPSSLSCTTLPPPTKTKVTNSVQNVNNLCHVRPDIFQSPLPPTSKISPPLLDCCVVSLLFSWWHRVVCCIICARQWAQTTRPEPEIPRRQRKSPLGTDDVQGAVTFSWRRMQWNCGKPAEGCCVVQAWQWGRSLQR